MTLLVFGITVPHVAQAVAGRELPRRLLEQWPKFLSYAVSFVVLAC
jgi:uncharacterized membrane protein